jgi:hypothetical protein
VRARAGRGRIAASCPLWFTKNRWESSATLTPETASTARVCVCVCVCVYVSMRVCARAPVASSPLSSLSLYLLSPTFLSRLPLFSPLLSEVLLPETLSHNVLTCLLSLLYPLPTDSPTLYFTILLPLLVPSPSLSPLSSLPFQARKKKRWGERVGKRERWRWGD